MVATAPRCLATPSSVNAADRWGHLETGVLPLVDAAAAGGFESVAMAPFRWPGQLAIVNRLEAATRTAGP